MREQPSNVSSPAEDLIDYLVDAGATLLSSSCWLLPGWCHQTGAEDALDERLRLTVWRLERAFATLTSDPRALEQAARELDDLLNQSRLLLIAVADLVETLAQEAEQAYGTQPGRGEFKQLQLKAAVLYLIYGSSLRLQGPPGVISSFLTPLLIEALVGWVADLVVGLLNRYQLWKPAPIQPPTRRLVAHTIWPTSRLLHWLSSRLTDLAWRLVLLQNPLRPVVRQAADSVEATIPGSIDAAVQLVTWMSRHRREVQAFTEIVSIAVNETEGFLSMSGPEKQAYARRLVMLALRENGFSLLDTPLGELVFGKLIDTFIDMVVHIFNKRAHFRHRSAGV